MPICQNCGTTFSSNIKIDGKIHNIKKRKYCFNCSPFGQHNTRNLNKNPKPSICGVCIVCKREYMYARKSGHTKDKCNSCLTKERRLKTKLKCIEYKGGECISCGYSKCPWCLCFHHTDPGQKDFDISRGTSYCDWETIRRELDKCLLLCTNCHGELHYNQCDIADFTPPTKDPPPHKLCPTCGNTIGRQAIKCRVCSCRDQEKISWPPTEELLNLLGSNPRSAVARMLGVSDSSLIKRLKNHPI